MHFFGLDVGNENKFLWIRCWKRKQNLICGLVLEKETNFCGLDVGNKNKFMWVSNWCWKRKRISVDCILGGGKNILWLEKKSGLDVPNENISRQAVVVRRKGCTSTASKMDVHFFFVGPRESHWRANAQDVQDPEDRALLSQNCYKRKFAGQIFVLFSIWRDEVVLHEWWRSGIATFH